MGYSVFGFLALLCHIFILRNYGRFLVLSRLWKTYRYSRKLERISDDLPLRRRYPFLSIYPPR